MNADINCDLDVDKFYRVVKNILENALDFNPEKIWITTLLITIGDRKYVELVIGNDNSYIEPENIEKIFDPFFTKGKSNGTGLGLAICSKIIKHHEGVISCQSDIKSGTEFKIHLPV